MKYSDTIEGWSVDCSLIGNQWKAILTKGNLTAGSIPTATRDEGLEALLVRVRATVKEENER